MATYMEFAQILEKKIRKEIEREAHPTERKTSPSQSEIHSPLWTHLVGHLDTRRFEASNKGQVYHRSRPTPRPRPDHVFTDIQSLAFEFFLQQGASLTRNFNSSDLKAAFRQLALKLHPDQGGSSAHFQKLMQARASLQILFK